MKIQTAIQLKVVSFHGEGNPIKLNTRQQAAVDEFVKRQVADSLNTLSDEVSGLVTALLKTTKE